MKQIMRKFDEACLAPVPLLSAEEIRALCEREGAWLRKTVRGPPPS